MTLDVAAYARVHGAFTVALAAELAAVVLLLEHLGAAVYVALVLVAATVTIVLTVLVFLQAAATQRRRAGE